MPGSARPRLERYPRRPVSVRRIRISRRPFSMAESRNLVTGEVAAQVINGFLGKTKRHWPPINAERTVLYLSAFIGVYRRPKIPSVGADANFGRSSRDAAFGSQRISNRRPSALRDIDSFA